MADQARACLVAKNQLQSPAIQRQGRQVRRYARHGKTVPSQLLFREWRTTGIDEKTLQRFPCRLRGVQAVSDLGADPVYVQRQRQQPCNDGEYNEYEDQLNEGKSFLTVIG
jgi:hypothetical protein